MRPIRDRRRRHPGEASRWTELARRASLALWRHQIILLPGSGPAETRRRAGEIERQLPPEFVAATWALTERGVIVWPAADHARSEALFARRNLRLDGIALSPEITPARSFDTLLWIVPPRRPAESVRHWLDHHQRPPPPRRRCWPWGSEHRRGGPRRGGRRIGRQRRRSGAGQAAEWQQRLQRFPRRRS